MGLVKANATVVKHLTGQTGLQDAIVRQRRVGPSDKAIVAIPSGLPVPQKAQVVRRFLVDGGERLALLVLVFSMQRCLLLW